MTKLLEWKYYLFSVIVITLNINKVISIGEASKFNVTLSDFFLPIAGLVVVILALNEKNMKPFKNYKSLILLIFWIVLSGLYAIFDPNLENQGYMGIAEELIKTVICIGYFWIGYNTLKFVDLKTLIRLLRFSVIFFIVFGFVIFGFAQKNIFLMGKASNYAVYYMGTDTDPNHAATYLSVMFFFISSLLTSKSTKKENILNVLVLILISIAIIMTGSRGGLLGFLVGVTILLAVFAKKNFKQMLLIVCLFVISLMMILNIDTYILGDVFSTRLVNKVIHFSEGFEVRYNLSKVAVEMGLDHPILGVGRGNYILNKDNYFNQLALPIKGDIPHNTYLGIFSELGIIGLILFSLPIITLIVLAVKNYHTNKKSMFLNANKLPYFIAICAAISVQAAVLNVENRRFLWFILGLLIYYYEHMKKTSSLYKNNDKEDLIASESKDYVTKKLLTTLYIFKSKKSILMVSSMVIILAVFTIANEKIDGSYIRVQNSYDYVIPVNVRDENQVIEFAQTIQVSQEQADQDAVNIKIIEVFDEEETVLIDLNYPSVKGDIKHKITNPKVGSKLVARYTVIENDINSFYVLPKKVVMGTQYKDLDKLYYLQVPIVRQMLEPLYWSKTDIENNQTHTENVGSYISDHFKIIDIQFSHGQDVFVGSVKLKAVSDILFDYKFWVTGQPDDLNDIEKDRFNFGYETYELVQSKRTSELNEGDELELVFEIPRSYGVYQLELGANYYDENQRYSVLIVDESGKSKLSIGTVNLDMENKGGSNE